MQNRKSLIAIIAPPLVALATAGAAAPAHAESGSEPFFNGLSVGMQMGWEERRIDETVLPGTLDATLSDKRDGFAYGGYVGFDKQFDSLVLGMEAGFSPNGKTLNADLAGGSIQLDSKWSADISVRAGLAVTPRLLAYGRVGYGMNRYRISGFTTGNATPVASDSETADGVIFGGGIEYAMHRNVSIRAEYRRKEFDGSLSSKQILGGVAARF